MRQWTEQAVVEAICRFAKRYDRAPTATDFNPSQAKAKGHIQRAERFHADGDYPLTVTVQRAFGSWNAAIAAAGLPVTPPGMYAHADRHEVHRHPEAA